MVHIVSLGTTYPQVTPKPIVVPTITGCPLTLYLPMQHSDHRVLSGEESIISMWYQSHLDQSNFWRRTCSQGLG